MYVNFSYTALYNNMKYILRQLKYFMTPTTVNARRYSTFLNVMDVGLTLKQRCGTKCVWNILD